MRAFSFFTGLLLQASYISAAIIPYDSTKPIEMDMWSYPGLYGGTAEWSKAAVWHKTLKVSTDLAYEDRLNVAHMCYDWLDKLDKEANARTDEGKNLLVSVMYDPSAQKLFVSTVPRGPQRKQMVAALNNPKRSDAPVWVERVRPLSLGTLTGSALYTSVSKALESLCPSATSGTMTSCSPTAEVKIGSIDYVASSGLRTNGELIIAVESSGYNLSSLRDALINSIAAGAQQGATGNNCYNAIYEVEAFPGKRDLGFLGWPISRFFKREDIPAPIMETKSMRICNTNWFAEANYYNIF